MMNACDKDTKEKHAVEKIVPFQRTRRITGYLVGGADRWVNAKKAELHDRVKHSNGE